MLCFVCAAQFKLTSEAKIQPVFTGREDMPVAFDFFHQGHALVTFYVRGLYDKKSASWSCFTSDVMYKKYKRSGYTSPNLWARFCK